MALNGRRAESTLNKLIKLVSFPVYQEPQNETYWELLDGEKDDILIYDHCGRLASHIRMPKSDMRFSYVWNGIFIVSRNQVCGKCKPVSPAKTTMAAKTRTVVLTTNTGRPVTSAPTVTKKQGNGKTAG